MQAAVAGVGWINEREPGNPLDRRHGHLFLVPLYYRKARRLDERCSCRALLVLVLTDTLTFGRSEVFGLPKQPYTLSLIHI